jgi:ketosteroid isomerase-like protein
MKKLAFMSFVLVLFTSSVLAQKSAGAAKADPTKPVRDAVERIAEAIRQANAETLMEAYDNSDRTLFFNNNGSATIGWSQMLENRKSSFAKTKNVTLDMTGLRVEMLGSASAYASFKWKQRQEYDGKLEDGSGRTTLVFKKIGTEWKVVHAHISPDSPSANRPVLDSERNTLDVPPPTKTVPIAPPTPKKP